MSYNGELYRQRNILLNKATSYRGESIEDTMKVRVQCFIQADALTQEIELHNAMIASPPVTFHNLYDTEGNITHMLLEDDGITRKYVRIARWLPDKVKINRKHPLDIYRYHEASVSRDELEFKDNIKALAERIGI